MKELAKYIELDTLSIALRQLENVTEQKYSFDSNKTFMEIESDFEKYEFKRLNKEDKQKILDEIEVIRNLYNQFTLKLDNFASFIEDINGIDNNYSFEKCEEKETE